GLQKLPKSNYAVNLGSSTYLHSIDGHKSIDANLRQNGISNPASQRGIVTVRMIPGYSRISNRPIPRNGHQGIWLYAHGKGVKQTEITDGLSKTVLASEVLPVSASQSANDDIRGVWVAASMGASTYSHWTTPNSPQPDNINGCDPLAKGAFKCIEIPPGTAQEGDTFAAARSAHPGGVNVVFADGRATFYLNEVDPKIWRAISTRCGGE
ncbi:MAG: DUF1559 domain-containing protein, partial [Planctomycetales bacterium]|nr:DUF1559 domain-containing protein [Planctomycetales bacterium]